MTNLAKRHYFANKGPSSQAMVFPVVVYGRESWTVKKAERQRIDAFELWCWRRLLTVQGTLKSLLQYHGSKVWILQCSAFFMVQYSCPYMTTGKTIALTRWTFVGRAMTLLFNMLSRFIITFLPSSRHLLISWLQSPSAVTWELKKIKPVQCFHFFSIIVTTMKGGKRKWDY